MDYHEVELMVKGRGSEIYTEFNEPIRVDENHFAEVGLKSLSVYNSIPNILEGVNNSIKIKVPDVDNFEIFQFSTGAYELTGLYEELIQWIELKYPKLQNVNENIILQGNLATGKCEFILKKGYAFSMNTTASIANVLGFEHDSIGEGPGKFIGQNMVNISTISTLMINTDISVPNYINSQPVPYIFSCTIDVPTGYRLRREVPFVKYKRVNTNQISSLKVWITDECGQRVNLRQEEVVVVIIIRIQKQHVTL